MHSTARTTVSAPVDRVWSVLADHEGLSNWAPGISATLTSTGATETNGVGAVRRISTPLPLPPIVEEVTTFEPGRQLSYKALSGIPLRNYHCDVVVEAADGGTGISYTVRADQRLPLVEKAMTKVIATGLLGGLVRAVKRAG